MSYIHAADSSMTIFYNIEMSDMIFSLFIRFKWWGDDFIRFILVFVHHYLPNHRINLCLVGIHNSESSLGPVLVKMVYYVILTHGNLIDLPL